MTSKNKYQDLVDSSTLKLDDDDLFENENHAEDFSIRHKPIFLWVKEIRDEISKVSTVRP